MASFARPDSPLILQPRCRAGLGVGRVRAGPRCGPAHQKDDLCDAGFGVRVVTSDERPPRRRRAAPPRRATRCGVTPVRRPRCHASAATCSSRPGSFIAASSPQASGRCDCRRRLRGRIHLALGKHPLRNRSRTLQLCAMRGILRVEPDAIIGMDAPTSSERLLRSRLPVTCRPGTWLTRPVSVLSSKSL